ncbi:MAG: aspartate-semialdehyde dehydrogenase [Pseudomonadota bacterium]
MRHKPETRKRDVEQMLAGHGLMSAEILYRMPDAKRLLQTFTWQDYDLAPDFPRLTAFLDYWRKNLDGPLHSVRYCHQRLVRPGEWRKVDGEFLVN